MHRETGGDGAGDGNRTHAIGLGTCYKNLTMKRLAEAIPFRVAEIDLRL